jgi:anti-anti-sigma regulatory factor
MPAFRSVSTIAAHDHACLLYASDDERWDVTAAYVDAGLRAGERVIYLAGDEPAASVVEALVTAGCARAREDARGQLQLPAPADVYPPGGFDPARLTAIWHRETAAALDAGLRGLRVVADMSWALRDALDPAALFAYEGEVGAIFDQLALSAVCLYDERRWAPAHVLAAACAHPAVLCGGWHHHAGPRIAEQELDLELELLGPNRLRVAGMVDHGTVARFADALRIASAGRGDLTLDAHELAFLDVRGAGALAAAARRFARAGRALRLVGAPKAVRRLLALLDDAGGAAPGLVGDASR